jgi:hypothetical protein
MPELISAHAHGLAQQTPEAIRELAGARAMRPLRASFDALD